MRHFLVILLGCCIVLATGCADYMEVLQLNADGTAQLRTTVAMNDLAASFGAEADLPGMPDKDFEDGSGRMWTERRDGQMIAHMEVEIADFREAKQLGPSEHPLGKYSPEWYGIQSLGLGRYRITRSVGRPELPKPDGVAGFGAVLGESLMDQMLEGHEFSVTIKAPFILSSNADEQPNRTTAVWKRDMASLAGEGDGPLLMEAVVLLIDYKLAGAVAGGVIAILIAVLLLKRRKPATSSTPPTSVDKPGAGL